MTRLPRTAWCALDLLWLAVWMAYAVAGYRDVPLHGDESTQIYMSRDYALLFQQRDLDAVRYTDSPADPADQHLRIVNGTVGKLTMGLGWDLAGLTADDLNRPWLWGAGWDYNRDNGHIPSERLLHAARLPQAIFLALSVAAVFGIAWLAGRGRAAAWIASLLYVTDPNVLVNGRRAMMEGSYLAFTTLAVLAGLLYVRAERRTGAALALGVMSGLAVASKHTAVIAVVAVFAALAVEPLVQGARRLDRANLLRMAGAGVLALIVFLLLNPAWWSDPLRMPGRVLDERRILLDGQRGTELAYHGVGERIGGLVDLTLAAGPQFYEVSAWGEYVGEQVAAYRDGLLDGRGGGLLWGIALGGLGALGLFDLARRWRDGVAWVVLAWAGVTAAALLAFTSVRWARYYLPLLPAVAVLAGIGVAWAGRGMLRATCGPG